MRPGFEVNSGKTYLLALHLFLSSFSLALQNASSSWSRGLMLLSRLTSFEPSLLVPYTPAIVGSFIDLMAEEVPRKIQTITCFLWYKLNTVIPRR